MFKFLKKKNQSSASPILSFNSYEDILYFVKDEFLKRKLAILTYIAEDGGLWIANYFPNKPLTFTQYLFPRQVAGYFNQFAKEIGLPPIIIEDK